MNLIKKKIFIFLILVIISVFLTNNIFKSNEKEKFTTVIENIETKVSLRIYELNKPNTENFECVRTIKIIVETTICIHDTKRDIFVSGAIKYAGIWEAQLVTIFMNMLNSKPNLNVLGKLIFLYSFTISLKF
jgi:hypothetical protein